MGLRNLWDKIRGNLRNFLDKKKGKEIDIEEFPFLFIMQSYTGMCGIFFSVLWFGILALNYQSYWNPYTAAFAAFVILGFGAMVVLSMNFTRKIVDRDLDDSWNSGDWDYYARRSMLILIVLFAVTCLTLIWLTGGSSSPFITFFVMVYTLTLTKCAIPHPGRALWISYTIVFIVAGVLAWMALPLIADPKVITAVKNGDAREYTDFLFAVMSMAVPYLSTSSAEYREAQRKRRAAHRAARAASPNNPQQPPDSPKSGV